MKYLFFILSIGFQSVYGQIAFNTGDVNLDAELNLINKNAQGDMSSFNADMRASFGVSDSKLDYMRGDLRMSAGDIYIALEIGKIARVKIDRVLTVYNTNRNKGWGYIAKEMGIKPGSREFHQLKDHTKSQSGKGSAKVKGNGKAKGKKH